MLVQCAKCGKHLTTAQLSPGSQGPQCVYCGATVPVFDQNTLVTQGQPAPVPSAAPPDLQIEGYEILGRLGEGGMGIVYLGRQVSLDRKVAIKVLSPGLLQDPSFLVRFDREIAALVRLSHPHIVTIFDRGQSAAGHVYYIMEYVEGESGGAPLDLERLIAEGRLDSQRTRELMLQVVQALGFAHREGIIHRDVKPTNILIDRHGFAKVADFGIACMRADFAARQVTMANASVGTAMYMSPEQQRDAASVDHRSDIYGAGIMLYQMLTSQLPLAGYAPPSIAVPGLSRQWDAIVAKAVQPRPENRFADMAELEVALRSLGATVVAQPLPVPTFPPVAPQKTAGGSVPTVCPQCGSQASDADQFCVTCGISLWTDCRQCAQKVFAAARFCPGCRADVENQRVFDDYLQLGRDWLEQARPGPPSTNCVRQLEQARLALVKALTCIDSADARSLVDEGNRLSSNFAWQAGEVAAQAKRLDEATYCYEQVLEASPGQGVATACLEKLRSYRGDLIKKAQRLFAEGQQKKAVTLLRTGVEQFENDDELLALLTQYHENSAQLRQLRDQIPALAEQHRWCEIMQILAELEQSGIPMKGFDEDAARAQQKLAAVEPLIAAATSSLEHGDPTQALALAERVLQEVADHAEAVEITKLARRRAASRRRSRRFAAVVFGVACLALIGGVGYVCVREALAIDE
ncbi:MAG: protein kinase, partial [Planctomycetota bacterium]|nr:protein kinase [Planctomycetota bacterium]